MDEQKLFLKVVQIVKVALANGKIEDEIHQLFDLCEKQDNAFITRLELIVEQLPEEKIDDVLHIAKGVSRIAFLRLLGRMHQRGELTMDILGEYTRQFGEDREILLAELMLLFKEGYEKHQERIEAIMQVVS